MRSTFPLAHALALLALSVGSTMSSPLLTKREPNCQNISFPVTISSYNAQLPTNIDPTSTVIESLLTNLVGWTFDVLVEGTFEIAGSYCEPEVQIPSRANTLQLLVHGGTYDRNYILTDTVKWSGDGAPGYGYRGDEYSWVSYASKQGYPTLAVDRLGNGLSDHPDPIVVVQMPAHVEVLAGVARLAKQGTSPLPRAFEKVIYVGHSFGSLIGNLVNEKYPNLVDATILTGWSNTFLVSGVRDAIGLVALPAQLVDPTQFGDLAVGYMEVSSESGDVYAFFQQGEYDPAMQALDWKRRGTLTLGELLTFPFAIAAAPRYTLPVLVVTAEMDAVFCNPTAGLLPPNCGTGPGNLLAQSASLYPAANPYDWYIVPNTGHCWQLHYNAPDGFNASHAWLEQQGF